MSDTQKRLHTLLTDRACEGLDESLDAELTHLLGPAGEIDPSYEQAAAGIELALLPHDEPLPSALVATLLAQADDYWRVSPAPAPALPGSPVSGTTQTGYMPTDLRLEAEAAGGPANWTGPQPKISAAIEDHRPESSDFQELPVEDLAKPRARKTKTKAKAKPVEAEESQAASHTGVVDLRRPKPVAAWAAYASAIAAVVVLGIAVWLFTHPRTTGGARDLETIQAQLDEASDEFEWSFAAKDDPAVGEGAGGSVIWSSDLQAGVMTLRGLAINQPTDAQYQLWIIDETRPGPPVDGGVFDVSAEGELAVPIDAKLLVGQPKAFAITVERPGGVVVSDQTRVVMLAAAP